MWPIAYAIVTTLRPKARDTPTRPIPTCGKPAAITALPHPAKVSQNVPINSAAYFWVFISRLPALFRVEKRGEQPRRDRSDPGIRAARRETGRFWRLFLAFPDQKRPSQVDIRGFVWYMPALRAKGQAFRRSLALPEFLSDQLKEDAACRFSSAITMSIKPSRR